MSFGRGMDKENVVYICNGILSSLKKEGNSAICDNTGESGGHTLSEVSWIEKDKYCMVSLICGILIKKKKKSDFIETENRMVVARVSGGNREM